MGSFYLFRRFTHPGGRQEMSNQLLFIAGLIVTFIFGAGALIHGLVQQGDSSAGPTGESESESES